MYVTTLLWQNNGQQNRHISRMLFSELYKIVQKKYMVKKVTFVGFMGGHRPNRPSPGSDPALGHIY